MGWMRKGMDFALNPFGIGDAFTENLTGGAPAKSYFGGSPEALQAQRDAYGQNAQNAQNLGAVQSRTGAGVLGQASDFAAQDRGAGYAVASGATSDQDQQINNLLAQAQQRTPSQAQAQMQMAQDENSRRMMGMATQARGGNQASALRNAQAMGSQNQLVTNQQLGVMRAQEEAQRQQNILGAQQYAAGSYGQRAGMGYGLIGQGTGQMGQSGAQLGQLGIAQQNAGLGQAGLLNDLNKSQLETDRGWSSAASVAGSPAGAFSSVLGGVTQLWGGGNKGQG